ncbi:hypothetical protein [Marilutibacter chinensis]|uniref:LTXXQ motif family protein n=1 Tax=Marilutibacter chinensis TaxID=2912247 RepID=A0ABS9HZJ6_9GAMM|nr:hypothetical protein [Lysobacter chinensis]MCF7223607.1 hypothetical protein [Lysobacter chinensis]
MKGLLSSVFAFGLVSAAHADEPVRISCDPSAAIAEYERARREEIPPLDRLPEAERQVLIGRFEELVEIIDERIAVRSGRAPTGTRSGSEESTRYARVAGAEVDRLLSIIPRSRWDDYRDEIAASIPALKGESSRTLGQVQDAINRGKIESILRFNGCPDDLAKDYGIPPYRP